MATFQNLEGRRFGRLVAESLSIKNRWNKNCWLCHCDCGGTATVVASRLIIGRTRSCGCLSKDKNLERKQQLTCARAKKSRLLNPERHKQNSDEWKTNNRFAQYVYNTRKGSKKYETEDTLTEAQWRSKVIARNFECWMCGTITTLQKNHPSTLSLDHIIPQSDGGPNSIDNVEPSCCECNMHRRDKSAADFRAWVERVYLHLSNISLFSAA